MSVSALQSQRIIGGCSYMRAAKQYIYLLGIVAVS